MDEYRYVIVGGGMAAQAAVEGIRSIDASGTIAMITSDPHPPYNRPPLSKALWKGEPMDSIWRTGHMDSVDLQRSTQAVRIDPRTKAVFTSDGAEFRYGKLLLATGAKVRRLPWEIGGIIYYRTVNDYHRLRTLAEEGRHILVIGGGFIGSEIAAALAMNKVQVSMVFPDSDIGARIYPSSLAQFLTSYFGEHGVAIYPRETIQAIVPASPGYLATTSTGRELRVDGIVAGLGVQPDTELATAAGLPVSNGITVDQYLRTSDPAIYAAGDVASFFNPALGIRMRVEHEDNAVTMGTCAGKNMAGDKVPYDHLPMFYSDLFDLGYEAVGELDARLDLREEWKEPFREGVVYYLREGRVRGVLLWNTWGQVDNARQLIRDHAAFSPHALKNRIPA